MKKILGCVSGLVLTSMGISAYAVSPQEWVRLSMVNLPSMVEIGKSYPDVQLKVTNPNSQSILLNALLDLTVPAGFTYSDADNNCKNITLSSEQSCYVKGTFTPESVDKNIWTTRVAVEGMGWDEVYSTSVIAHGLDLDATKDVSKLIAFNGDTDTGTIDVTNNSAEPLTSIVPTIVTPIDGLSLTETSNCANPLPVGATCTYSLTYTSPTNPTGINIKRDKADIRFTYGTSYASETLDDEVNILSIKKGYYISLPTFNKGVGLASSAINSVTAENQGRDIYLTTEGGLSISHDAGQTYRSYSTNDGLAANNNRLVSTNESGQVIAITGITGLTLSTDGGNTFQLKTTTDGLGGNVISDAKFAQGKLYVATNGGLSVSSDNGQTFTTKTTSNGLGSDSVYGLAVSEDGQTILAATAGGLSISTDGGNTFINKTTADGLYNNVVLYVAMSADCQTIYTVNYYGGLNKSTDGGAHFTPIQVPGLSPIILYGVSISPNGQTVLVASSTGLGLSTDGGANYSVKTTADGLGDNYISQVFYDPQTDNILVATKHGFSMLAAGDTIFTNNAYSSGLAAEDLRSLMLSSDGHKLYVGSYLGGLNVSSDNGNTFSTINSGLNSTTVSQLAQSSDGQTIYAGTSKGLSISTNGGTSFTPVPELCGNATPLIGGLYVNPLTNKIYVGLYYNTESSYVNALYAGDNTFSEENCSIPTNSALPNNLIEGVAATNDDSKVYLATNGGYGLGVGAMVNNKVSTMAAKTTANGLGNNNIENVQVSGDGQTVYAATFSGLGVSTNAGDNFDNYTTANGLIGNSIRGILTANNGQTWYVPIYGGLSISFDGGAHFTTETTANGLGSDNVRMPVLTQDGTGLFVPTEQGLYFTKVDV